MRLQLLFEPLIILNFGANRFEFAVVRTLSYTLYCTYYIVHTTLYTLHCTYYIVRTTSDVPSTSLHTTYLPMPDQLHEVLACQCDARRTWKCKMSFQETYCPEDKPNEVSLCNLLRGKQDYLFPECYTGKDSEAKLVSELKMAALLDGFKLSSGSRKDSAHFLAKKSDRVCEIALECSFARRQRERVVSGNRVRNTHSKRATTKEGCCGFRFTVYLHSSSALEYPNRWFMATATNARRPTCDVHSGHFKYDTEDIKVSTAMMTEEQRKLAIQCSQLHL